LVLYILEEKSDIILSVLRYTGPPVLVLAGFVFFVLTLKIELRGSAEENFHTHLMEGHWKLQEGEGSQKPNGEFKPKDLRWREGVWIFSGKTHYTTKLEAVAISWKLLINLRSSH